MPAGGSLRRRARERCAQLVEARAGLGADRDDLRLGHELLRFRDGELERLRVDRVGLGHGHDAALDPEQPQDREVLVRLRPRALAGVDHQQEEVDPGRARDHRAHETLVTGHVDQRQARSVGQLERRVAERDRDPALLLLGQAVGVLARQRPDEPRLAVVDVPRGADGQRHESTLPTGQVPRCLTMIRHGFSASQTDASSSSGRKPRDS